MIRWVLRPASPADAGRLTELAMESKASWGYSYDFMEACRSELTITVERIAGEAMTVAESAQGEVLGFASVLVGGEVADLADLFVAPNAQSGGVGRALWNEACRLALAEGCSAMTVEADPHALDFYRSRGAVVVGEAPSGSIPGRMLPLLEVDLEELREAPPTPRGS